MKIQQINNTNINISNFRRNISFTSMTTATHSLDSPDRSALPNYGESLVYMQQMDKLKNETKAYPKDVEYRKTLLANAGLNPENQHKIRSIIGTQELKEIMKEFNDNETVYSSGENFSNVASRDMRANLHMHTIASDGSLSIQELLDNAVEYADKVAKENPNAKKAPFIVGITDHDTTESVQEAIKIISEKPLKYKNLRVVLGVEMTTYNNIAPDLVHKPTNTHVLVYGIDPNEETFKAFIDGTKAKKRNIENLMVNTANKTYKEVYGKDTFFSLPQAKVQYNQLNKDIVGIYNNLDGYFQNKIAVENVVLKNKTITQALKKHDIPTDTDGFMDKMREFRFPIDRNNKIPKPEEGLPEFISACTDLDKETVTNIITDGLKEEKVSKATELVKQNISEYKVTLNPKYDYMPTFKTLYGGLKGQKQTIMGIAHPIDTTSPVKNNEDKYTFLEDLYSKFKKGCKEKAKFSEVYYQSYKPERKEFKENPVTQKFMDGISKLYKLFKTGSQDTHGLNIFKR